MPRTFSLLFAIAFSLSACAPQAMPVPTALSSETPAPTATAIETPLPTATSLPETWISAKNGTGIALPAELFDLVKDQNPYLSDDGEQIINAESDEVLLENQNGQWLVFKPVVELPALDELITSLDEAQVQEAMTAITEQFEGGLEKEHDSWHFLAVGGEIITHEEPIQLPGGYEVSHTFALQYVDAEGNDQVVHIPIFIYNKGEKTAKLVGYGVMEDVSEDRVDSDIVDLTHPDIYLGRVGALQRVGWTGPGHIFYINFALPEGDEFSQWSGQGYLNEVMQELYSEESLAEFARTGNPETLIKIPGEDDYLLLPVDVDMKNWLGAMQTANFDDWAGGVAP